MIRLVLRIYDFMQRHNTLRNTLLVASTLLLVALMSRLHYKEDITDFLPLDSHHQQAMTVYRDISGSNRIIVIFSGNGQDESTASRMVEAADDFCNRTRKALKHGQLPRHNTIEINSQSDLERIAGVTEFIYSNIPYFLTTEDYRRMDSLLALPGYTVQKLQADRQMLLFPSGGLLESNLQYDPLSLFSPVIERLQQSEPSYRYELFESHIFSPDMNHTFVMVSSPFGPSETENNGKLTEILDKYAQQTQKAYPGIRIRLAGGPVVAVGNASQIKSDSIISIALAGSLILLLLACYFRSGRNLMLIFLSIAWGWLFAMGALSLLHQSVSIIVIGISSIIIGIAVNYPLHLIAHLHHTPSMRQALREIILPLTVGNITTVGAFLTLVPLQSAAMRDLGLFSAFLLIGTILFVIVFLPHLAHSTSSKPLAGLGSLGSFSIHNKPRIVSAVAMLTIVLGFFSFRTGFDTNLSHINYMTDEEKTDLAYLEQLSGQKAGEEPVYLVSTGHTLDEALEQRHHTEAVLERLWHGKLPDKHNSVAPFLCSKTEQRERLQRWKRFVSKNHHLFTTRITTAAETAGFAPEAFRPFMQTVSRDYAPQEASYFQPLTASVLSGLVTYDKQSDRYSVVDKYLLPSTIATKFSAKADSALTSDPLTRKDSFAFNISGLNSKIATNLSDDFNYIGYACGFIVFLFLWLTLGSIELAALSFLPMAVSWVWILGLMGLFGLDFNIVNVILATFIFGQGDDCTIFMTEGCQYEYAYGKRMLGSYKNSISLSALIMFIGMGALILARHPALHSLGTITIVGMLSVVLMAYLLPPLVFRWLITDNTGKLRRCPITLANFLCPRKSATPIALVRDNYRYRGAGIWHEVRSRLKHEHNFSNTIETLRKTRPQEVTIYEQGYGEESLLTALTFPEMTVWVSTDSEQCRQVMSQLNPDLAPNMQLKPASMIKNSTER